jgi:GNAT superfamily N-acetyltransferase
MTIEVRSVRRHDLPILKCMIHENIEYLNAIDEPEEVSDATIDQIEGLVFGPSPLSSVVLAELDREVAGYLLYFLGVDMDEVAPALHINDLFVRIAAHRHDVGRALMNRAREIAVARGAARLFWTVWRKNPQAIEFYRSLGAEVWDEELPMTWNSRR